MTHTSLDTAFQTLQEAVNAHGTELSAQLLERTTAQATQLLTQNIEQCLNRDDPRLTAALLSKVEQLSHVVHRARLQLSLQAAATGAHTLDLEEYDALREQSTDYDRPARHASGRPCYKSPAEFLAAWLRIDYHEATGMLADAQLVVGRITVAGTMQAPRFTRMSERWLDPTSDPRAVLRATRALNRLEPEDTIAEGTPLAPAATHSDGRSLEDHVSELLRNHDPRSGRKHVDTLISEYRQAHTETTTPEEGLTLIRTINGVDDYRLRVKGLNAGLLRSVVAKSDNPKTQAGAAARRPSKTRGEPQPAAVPTPEESTYEEPTPAWLTTTDPAPEWSGIQSNPDPNPTPAPGTELGTDSVPLDPAASISEQIDELVPPRIRRMNALMSLIEQRLSHGSPRPQDSEKGQSDKGQGHASPKIKTVEPELLVFMKLTDLRDLATASGVTSHGVKLSATELRKLLCRSKIIPIVFGGDGQVLDLGRSSRFYPDYLKKGIIARDRGCLVPGCSVPPEICDVHHAEQGGWQGGCPTDIRSGSLLCRAHHTAEQAGIIKVIMHRGLPHVLLPRHLDPTQTPRRNTYWLSDTAA